MNVFNYSDYRKFLKDWLDKAKKSKGMSAAQVAQVLEIHPSFLSQVALENKDFTNDHWIGFCNFADLSHLERDYLLFLFLRNRSATKSAQDLYDLKLDELKKRSLQVHERFKNHQELSESDKSTYYSNWIYSSIRMFCMIGDGQSIEDIAAAYGITKERASEITEFLLRSGLCEMKKGLVSATQIHTHVKRDSPLNSQHQLNWRIQAIKSLENRRDDEVHFCAPMSISKKEFPLIREKIFSLIQEIVEITKDNKPEDLATITIDFFWQNKK